MAGNSAYSDTVNVNMGGVPATLSVFPNPADTYLTVLIPKTSEPSQLEMVDMAGRVVVRVQVNLDVQRVNITTSGLPNGVYKLIWNNRVSNSLQLVLVLRK